MVSNEVTIFPLIRPVIYPPAFQNNWAPQVMPAYQVPVQPAPYVVVVHHEGRMAGMNH
jgi:hypothetical protein